MTEATIPATQLERAVIPWSRPDGLPPLGEHDGPSSYVVPSVPVALLNLEAGRALHVRPLLDTGCEDTVFSMQAAEQLGLDPGDLAHTGAFFDMPLKHATRDVFACRLEAVIAGRWQVAIDVRFVECADTLFGGSGLLGRDILNHFVITFDGPGRTVTLAREGA